MSAKGSFSTVLDPVDNSSILIFIEEGVALISFVLIMILFWWTFLSFQNSQSISQSHKLKYLCLTSLSSFFFMSFIAAMLINDLVTQHLTLGMCRVIYPLYLIFYNVGKISIDCLVSVHQQLIFNQDLYSEKNLAISPITSNIYRIFCIIIPTVLWGVIIFLGVHNMEIINVSNPLQNNQYYHYCYMREFDHVLYAQASLAMIAILGTILRLISLSIFNTKSIKVAAYYKQNMNTRKRDIIVKLSKLMRKNNVLDFTSMITTLLFLICAAYVFQQLIFFLIIDAVICSCCTIALFQFGNKLYIGTCLKCESYCICLYCLEKNLQNKRTGLEYEAFPDEDLVRNKSFHLKETGSKKNENNKNNENNGNNNNGVKTNKEEEKKSGIKLNKTGTGTIDTAALHASLSAESGLLQAGNTKNNEQRKSTRTAVTMLSGFEHVVPKDIEVTSDRQIENINTSLLSVSEFL